MHKMHYLQIHFTILSSFGIKIKSIIKNKRKGFALVTGMAQNTITADK